MESVLNFFTGVHLSLNGTNYANNSVIIITVIGETNTTSNTGLQCITDKRPCCQIGRTGEWYFPDGAPVPVKGGATIFYRNRGGDGTVNLNRLSSNVMSPTGLFCCVVPDAADVTQKICAIIGELMVNAVLLFVVMLSRPRSHGSSTSSPMIITNITFSWAIMFDCFERTESGDFTCTATILPQPSFSTFLVGIGQLSNTTRVTTGTVYIDVFQHLL